MARATAAHIRHLAATILMICCPLPNCVMLLLKSSALLLPRVLGAVQLQAVQIKNASLGVWKCGAHHMHACLPLPALPTRLSGLQSSHEMLDAVLQLRDGGFQLLVLSTQLIRSLVRMQQTVWWCETKPTSTDGT